MKKLGVLFVTLLTAIVAFSFTAFADEPLSSSTLLTMSENGAGEISTHFYFGSSLDDKPSNEFINEIKNNFNNSGLENYVDLDIESTNSITFNFTCSFNSIDDFNSKMFQINQCTLGYDCKADSSITCSNNEKTLSLSHFSLTTLNKAANYFLFYLNPIEEKTFINDYYVLFGDPYYIEYCPVFIDDLEYNDYITFSTKISADSTVAPSVTSAPSTANTATAKPVTNKKTAVTTKNITKKDNSPKTSDSNNIILLVSLMFVSITSMGFVAYKKFHKN